MRGDDRLIGSQRALLSLCLVVLLVTAGCQGFLEPTESTPSPSPTVTETERPALTSMATPTPAPTPGVTQARVLELQTFADGVNERMPMAGNWTVLDAETVRYRTTPDFHVRDAYGVGADPPPEAIAREMADSEEVAPETAIIEVVSEDGEFLGEFNVTKDVALAFDNYRLSPGEFVNVTTRTGNYSDGYFGEDGARIESLSIDHIELRKAYLNRTLQLIEENATDFDTQMLDSGLYNHSYAIPKQDLRIPQNSTIYLTIQIPPGESSQTLSEIIEVWPSINELNYYDFESPRVTLQTRVYNATG